MKTLRDYSRHDPMLQEHGFPVYHVADAIAYALTLNVKEIALRDDEYNAFLIAYDSVLPWNWNGKAFRGIKIHRIKPHVCPISQS